MPSLFAGPVKRKKKREEAEKWDKKKTKRMKVTPESDNNEMERTRLN